VEETEVYEEVEKAVPVMGTVQIGTSRPPLPVTDLPTPEEAFKIKGPMTPGKVIRYVIGPSLIALGVSIGSGEWLIGPHRVGTFGFVGVLWIVLVSALLQVFYNIELARYTVATGETPAVGFGRVFPGLFLWIPLAVFLYWLAFIWGGWAAGAGQSLMVLLTGRFWSPGDPVVKGVGAALLFVVFGIVLFGKRISRTMEITNWFIVIFVLISVITMVVLVVPPAFTASAFAALVTPAAPPPLATPTQLGALAGFTATASGVNYFIISYYRDKGYGMGHRVGYIAALVGGKQEKLLASGMTFPDDEKNRKIWKRWWNYLLLDQWGVFFTGAIIGMMMPVVLVAYLRERTGTPPLADGSDMPVYAGTLLTSLYGSFIGNWAYIVGFLILFSTQMVVFEALTRQFVDGAHAMSARFRKLTREDPRRFYYPFMLLLATFISLFVWFGGTSLELVQNSANFSNLASLIIPFAVIYLNRKLPAPARMKWWSYVVLLLNVIFFGYFFINFVLTNPMFNPLKALDPVIGLPYWTYFLILVALIVAGLSLLSRRAARAMAQAA
jgi:hypothetical protein